MGLSDYPSNSQKRLEGVAVGLFVRYPLSTGKLKPSIRTISIAPYHLSTGNLASSVRTIPIAYVQFFVPGYYLQIYHGKDSAYVTIIQNDWRFCMPT